MSREALESDPDFRPILERYREAVAVYPQSMEAYRNALEAGESAAATTSGPPYQPTPAPTPPPDPATLTTRPSGLFNAKIAPLAPFAIRGIIWWQGEYNSERGEQYKKLFPALIRDWRSLWKSNDLPFLFVQLQNLDIQPQPNAAHYDELREAQLFTLQTVPHTGMVVACDVGDANDIHPKNKQAVGARLALIARGILYGETELVYSGPILQRSRPSCIAVSNR
jgi:sialate O-acetylesterase